MIKEFKHLIKGFSTDTHIRLAIAEISYSFPKTCNYPCLSSRLDDFGLINPLEGRTVATLPEIHLALYQGAKIKYHDAVVISDTHRREFKIRDVEDKTKMLEDEEMYVFRKHLFKLYRLRKEAKDADEELLQQLYKTYSNSLYGKNAQGIRDRTMFNTKDGSSKPLPKSTITNSYYASMTTGLIRAALASLLVAIDELIQDGHPYIIISATTDGLLYGIDDKKLSIEDTFDMKKLLKKYDSVAEALKDGYKKFKSFGLVDPLLAERLNKFPALKLLELSHEAWNDPEYIEIKHVANSVLNVKTRGQVGFYEDETTAICTLLAKAGHKIPGSKDEQAQWIMQHYKDDKILEYEYSRLSNIQAIIDSDDPIEDLVSVKETRKISLDYDYKRKPINATDTAPHKDANEFRKYRQSAYYLRQLGQRANVDAVEYKYQRAKQGVRMSGSNTEFTTRHILRALLQGVKPFKIPTVSYTQLSITLQEFKVTTDKLKRAKQAAFTSNMIEDTSGNRALIRRVLRTLNIRTSTNYKNYLDLLLHKKISNPEEVSYLD